MSCRLLYVHMVGGASSDKGVPGDQEGEKGPQTGSCRALDRCRGHGVLESQEAPFGVVRSPDWSRLQGFWSEPLISRSRGEGAC